MKKSYYAIIPANIRYDKDLTPNAKLLYGEITALCNQEGYCWANNRYFADLYEVSINSVSSWVKQLAKKGYITTKLIYAEDSKQVSQRRIYLAEATPIQNNLDTPPNKLVDPIQNNLDTPPQENLEDNNTSYNNTINKDYNKYFERVWSLYPNKIGKGRISNTKKKEVFKLGEEFERCISRYIKYVEAERKKGFKDLKYQNGSTFFNSGYVDYMDSNVKEKEKPKRPPLKKVYREL